MLLVNAGVFKKTDHFWSRSEHQTDIYFHKIADNELKFIVISTYLDCIVFKQIPNFGALVFSLPWCYFYEYNEICSILKEAINAILCHIQCRIQ